MTPITSELNINTMVSVVLGLQFAAFGWRINREIPVGDSGRRTWFPVPDIINIVSMFCVVWFCVVEPLELNQFTKSSRVMLSMAVVLLAFHPIGMIGHYRLFTREGRTIYLSTPNGDYPYYTIPELIFVVLGTTVAASVGARVWLSSW